MCRCVRDEAIKAIRAVRHQISAEHQHNTRLLIRHYQEMDKQYAARMLRRAGLRSPEAT